MSIKLSELGFDPYIIGTRFNNHDISFLRKFTKVKVNNILMVNSDQTWRKSNFFYDIAFLNFSKNWNKPKFVYAASLGLNTWQLTKEDENIAKNLLKNFTGISVREKGSIKLIESHLGIKPIFVLDPTLLIDKKYYLKLIKNYKNDILIDNSFIFVYTVTDFNTFKNYINSIREKYYYKIYLINCEVKNHIKKFIYGIYNSRAVITDSFHGTIFSIIFNKPFISFVYEENGRERFNTLKEIFNLQNRIYDWNSTADLKLLDIPLDINKTVLSSLKTQSINFLKNNLIK
jgi:polysaccharide pyruvyl transferase WcaK-like protein